MLTFFAMKKMAAEKVSQSRKAAESWISYETGCLAIVKKKTSTTEENMILSILVLFQCTQNGHFFENFLGDKWSDFLSLETLRNFWETWSHGFPANFKHWL